VQHAECLARLDDRLVGDRPEEEVDLLVARKSACLKGIAIAGLRTISSRRSGVRSSSTVSRMLLKSRLLHRTVFETYVIARSRRTRISCMSSSYSARKSDEPSSVTSGIAQ
jgi:hypothetical protein